MPKPCQFHRILKEAKQQLESLSPEKKDLYLKEVRKFVEKEFQKARWKSSEEKEMFLRNATTRYALRELAKHLEVNQLFF